MLLLLLIKSLVSSVSKLTGYGLDSQTSICSRGSDFSFGHQVHDSSEAYPAS